MDEPKTNDGNKKVHMNNIIIGNIGALSFIHNDNAFL